MSNNIVSSSTSKSRTIKAPSRNEVAKKVSKTWDEDAETEAYDSDESVYESLRYQRSLAEREGLVVLDNEKMDIIEISDEESAENNTKDAKISNLDSPVSIVDTTSEKPLACESQRSKLDHRMFALEETIVQLKNQIVCLKRENDHRNSDKYLKDELEKFRIQNQNLLFKVGSMTRRLIDQKSKLTRLQNENDKLKSNMEKLQAENRLLSEEKRGLLETLQIGSTLIESVSDRRGHIVSQRANIIQSSNPRSSVGRFRSDSFISRTSNLHPYLNIMPQLHQGVNARKGLLGNSPRDFSTAKLMERPSNREM